MAMRINGVGGSFSIPRVLKNYVFTKFDAKMSANVAGTNKTVDIKAALESAWQGVVQKSKQKPCNDYFKTLFHQKTLAEVMNDGDIVFHCLEPKQGFGYDILPEANTAGRDIGIDPTLLFGPDSAALICTIIHELAHVAGASTDAGAAIEKAHAAEKALLSCSCKSQYRKDVLGSNRNFRPGAGFGQRYA